MPVRSVVLVVSHWCNFRCTHCFDGDDHSRDIARADVFDVLERLACSGVGDVELSGGEVTLVPELPRILSRCRELGLSPRVFTNGSVRSWPYELVDGASVSIDGTRATHNTIRGRAYAFDRVVRTLEKLGEHGVRTHVQMTAWDGNLDQILAVAQLVRSFPHVRSLHVAGVLALGAATNPGAPRLDPANYQRALEHIGVAVIELGNHACVTTNIARRTALLDHRHSAASQRLRLPVIVDAARDTVHVLSQSSMSLCSATGFDPDRVDARTRAVAERVTHWDRRSLPSIANVEQLLLDSLLAVDADLLPLAQERR